MEKDQERNQTKLDVSPNVRAAAYRRLTMQPAGVASGCNWGRSSNAGVEAPLGAPRLPLSHPRPTCAGGRCRIGGISTAPKCGRCQQSAASSNAGVTVFGGIGRSVATTSVTSSGGCRVSCIQSSASDPDRGLNSKGIIAKGCVSSSRCEASSSTGGICSHSTLASENFGELFPFLRSSPEDLR